MIDVVADRDLVRASASPSALRLEQGERALVRVTVENRATVVDQFALVVEGVGSEFYEVKLGQISLFPGQTGELELEVHLPSDALIPAGVEHIALRVASRHDPRVEAAVSVPLEIALVRRVGIDIRPAQVHTRSQGRFRVAITNAGNAQQVLDLTVGHPDDGLRSFMDRDRVAIAPGDTREAEIRVKPRRRPLHGFPTYYRFVVTAADALDPTQDVISANGVLVYQPPFGWLGAIFARLRALAILLLIVLVGLCIVVWVLGAPGERKQDVAAPAVAVAPEATPQGDVGVSDTAPGGTGSGTGGANASGGGNASGGASGSGALDVASAANPPAAAGGSGAGDGGGSSASPGSGAGPATAAPVVPGGNPAGAPQAAPSPTAIQALPLIVSFAVSAPPPDAPPGLIQITWEVRNVTEVTIGGAKLPASGVALIQGLQRGELELVARNAAGEARRSLGLLVLQPPQIDQFTATPLNIDPGQPVSLAWQVERAETARLFGPELDPAGVAVDPTQGAEVVSPTQTATYTLRAENALGRVEESVPVGVTVR